jgi:hypothetical protein
MLQKFILLLIPLFLTLPNEDNLIEWKASRKLTWDDFQGTPNPSTKNAALTNSSITVEFGYNNKGLTHSIKCRFNKSLSWGRIKNDYILNHEQGHFDIAEAHARILHKRLSAYKFNAKTVNKDINDIYDGVMKQHVSTQERYDLETNHSLIREQQDEWDEKIASVLKEHEEFADYK